MPGKIIGAENQALICTPLVGKTKEEILTELRNTLKKNPDLIEWRADYFTNITDTTEVLCLGKLIKETAGATTIIFTIRSSSEGGQPTALSDQEAIELTAAICQQTDIEYVDCELRNTPEAIAFLRQTAKQSGTKIIGSYHNFANTPSYDILQKKFADSEAAGLDVAKLAIMPNSMEDALMLMSATLAAKKQIKIPLIALSMGGCGVITRMFASSFGSSVTYAIGQNSSAPGQVPIDDLRLIQKAIEKSK